MDRGAIESRGHMVGNRAAVGYEAVAMAEPTQAPADTKECCRRTRERWERQIRAYYVSFPVIKDVPCDGCRQILEIRVFGLPPREPSGT